MSLFFFCVIEKIVKKINNFIKEKNNKNFYWFFFILLWVIVIIMSQCDSRWASPPHVSLSVYVYNCEGAGFFAMIKKILLLNCFFSFFCILITFVEKLCVMCGGEEDAEQRHRISRRRCVQCWLIKNASQLQFFFFAKWNVVGLYNSKKCNFFKNIFFKSTFFYKKKKK